MATLTSNIEKSNVRGNYRSYSVQQKRRALEIAEQQGFKPTARLLKIPPSTLLTWRAKFAAEVPLEKKRPGQPARFPEQERELCAWILRKREQHLPVSRQAICDQALKIINHESFTASSGWLDRFMKRNGLSVRCKTSTAQHLPEDLQVRSRIFLRQLEELRAEQDFDTDCIVNMDETPVYFDLVPGKTVDRKGVKDVVVRSTGAHKRHVTVVLAVTASGETLPPMVIFKGKRFPKDITKVPDGIFVEMQPNGWMTQDIMDIWISKILRPYTKRRPALLVMDSFTGHTTESVTQALWKINATPVIIPGGCTSKLQPLDVSINKPFKTHLRQKWTSYLSDLADRQVRLQTASRQTLLQWVLESWRLIEAEREMISKSFRVTGITGAIDRAEADIARNLQGLHEALMSDDSSSSWAGFSPEDLPPEPEGYDSDPFLEESDDEED